jgi:hypothetical protein
MSFGILDDSPVLLLFFMQTDAMIAHNPIIKTAHSNDIYHLKYNHELMDCHTFVNQSVSIFRLNIMFNSSNARIALNMSY